MKKPKIRMKIIKEEKGYGAHCTVHNRFIATEADTFEELQTRVVDAVNLTFEEENFVYSIDEIEFVYDLVSFFAFYQVINTEALSLRIGMKTTLLDEYISGTKKPSDTQTRRILKGIEQIGTELSEARFLLRNV